MANENKIGALWLKEKNGKKFFSGEIELNGQKHSVVVFRNTYKEEGSKQPDYNILLSQGQSQQKQDTFEDDVPI
jgi:hypothetical protein